jgi:hypothetical protein
LSAAYYYMLSCVDRLLGVVGGAGLSDDCYLDLAGVFHGLFNFLDDVPGQPEG